MLLEPSSALPQFKNLRNLPTPASSAPSRSSSGGISDTSSMESRISTLEAQIRSMMAIQEALQKRVEGGDVSKISRAVGTDPAPPPRPDEIAASHMRAGTDPAPPPRPDDITASHMRPPMWPAIPRISTSPNLPPVGLLGPSAVGANTSGNNLSALPSPMGHPQDHFSFPPHEHDGQLEEFSDIFNQSIGTPPRMEQPTMPSVSPISRAVPVSEAVPLAESGPPSGVGPVSEGRVRGPDESSEGMELAEVASQPGGMGDDVARTGLGAVDPRTFPEQDSADSIASSVQEDNKLPPAGTEAAEPAVVGVEGPWTFPEQLLGDSRVGSVVAGDTASVLPSAAIVVEGSGTSPDQPSGDGGGDSAGAHQAAMNGGVSAGDVADAPLDQHPPEPMEGIVEDNSVGHSLDLMDQTS